MGPYFSCIICLEDLYEFRTSPAIFSAIDPDSQEIWDICYLCVWIRCAWGEYRTQRRKRSKRSHPLMKDTHRFLQDMVVTTLANKILRQPQDDLR